jgi:hypothetical protein
MKKTELNEVAKTGLKYVVGPDKTDVRTAKQPPPDAKALLEKERLAK